MKPSPSDVAALNAWVADELTEFVGRLSRARSEGAARELEAARTAFDAAARSIESALAAPPGAPDEIRGFMARFEASPAFDQMRAALEGQEAANQRLCAALKEAERDRDAAQSGLHAERERAEDARASLAHVTAEYERALEELRQDHATVLAEQSLACTSLPLDELLTVFSALGRATTVHEVQTSLFDGIAREFPRVALFEVHGNRLQGARQVGLDLETDISKVTLPLTGDSFLARAVSAGRLESFFAGLHGGPRASIPFGGAPVCALAIPVVVRDATVAVIYADDSDKPEFANAAPQARAKFAELLHQHAMLVLLRLWIEQKTLEDLHECATKLVNDLEYAHAADADLGTNPLERQRRLREALERSRRLYAQRVAVEGGSAAALLDECLAATMEKRRDTVFGRDLVTIFGPVSTARRGRVVAMTR